MNVKMCGYDVSISARHIWQDKKSKQATLEFLNYLSIVLEEASNNYRKEGLETAAATLCNYSDELYDICKDNGLYNS